MTLSDLLDMVRQARINAQYNELSDDDIAALRQEDGTVRHCDRITEPGDGTIHACHAGRHVACTRSRPSTMHQKVSHAAPIGCPACRAALRLPPFAPAIQWPLNVRDEKELRTAALYTRRLIDGTPTPHAARYASTALHMLDLPRNVQAPLLPALEAIAAPDPKEDK